MIVKRRLEWEAVLAFQYFFELFLRNEEKFHYFAKAWAYFREVLLVNNAGKLF